MTHTRGLKTFHVSRRAFIAAGAAAAGFGPLFTDGIALGANEPVISPGFFASQVYDHREKEGFAEVVDSGSPFRYWGPAEPRKVKTFEEMYARHMKAAYALAVTSGTAALDCAVTGLGIGAPAMRSSCRRTRGGRTIPAWSTRAPFRSLRISTAPCASIRRISPAG